jgi:Glycosyl hydrolase family 99
MLIVCLAGVLVLAIALTVALHPWEQRRAPATGTAPPPGQAVQSSARSGGESAAAVGPSPAGSAASDWQPAFPIRAAFYYPWFPEAWQQAGMNPFTHYHPSLGQYNVSSPSVLSAHVKAMRYAGLQAGIASWWGRGTATDRRIGQLLGAAAGQSFRWSVYYEAEGQGDPTVGQLTGDLTYLRDRYGHDPRFLRIDGRFVVFVYAEEHDACAMADRWKRANTVGAYVVLKVFSGYRGCASQPDGWHQYGPAKDVSDHRPFAYSVSPGFWKASESTPRLARDRQRWRVALRAMVASNARFQLVTTFNEWGEGTSVESATEWTSPSGMGDYLDALHDILGGARP